jgi:hypothetical protein
MNGPFSSPPTRGWNSPSASGVALAATASGVALAATITVLLLLLLLLPGALVAQSFQGSGASATEPFSLSPGLVVVEMSHEGTGRFQLRLLDVAGGFSEELAAGEGTFHGSRALQLPAAEAFLLDVAAQGAWHVRFRRLGEVGSAELEALPEMERAREEALSAAGEPGVLGWFGGGFAAGLVAGPVGAVLATYGAGRRDVELTPSAESRIAGEDPLFSQAFQEAYTNSLRERRQRAALRGSLVGSAALAFIIIRYTDLARPGSPGENGTPPDIQRVPIVRIQF